jgi:hypothetical protein
MRIGGIGDGEFAYVSVVIVPALMKCFCCFTYELPWFSACV